mmetsp:Transcript_9710/g.21616  ORF Transcript_9710/g.21616 Transcript_9710/m.21616 type:complete len:223 (+) Transcript_9710:448-1116(+)
MDRGNQTQAPPLRIHCPSLDVPGHSHLWHGLWRHLRRGRGHRRLRHLHLPGLQPLQSLSPLPRGLDPPAVEDAPEPRLPRRKPADRHLRGAGDRLLWVVPAAAGTAVHLPADTGVGGGEGAGGGHGQPQDGATAVAQAPGVGAGAAGDPAAEGGDEEKAFCGAAEASVAAAFCSVGPAQHDSCGCFGVAGLFSAACKNVCKAGHMCLCIWSKLAGGLDAAVA